MIPQSNIKTGLHENWKQFSLLVAINGFVGAMIGLERAVLSDLGSEIFQLNAYSIVLSFVAAFGLTKALSNLLVTKLLQKYSRKQILVTGWIFALPVPLLLLFAQSWYWVIAANIFLGINQGLSWSATVIMKIDLVGPSRRGLAMGINEFAGYVAVGLASYLGTHIAIQYGLVFYPFLPSIFFALSGLLLSHFFIRDTAPFVSQEATLSKQPIFKDLWKQMAWKHQNLGSVSINGFLNNLNDAVIWGLGPLLLSQKGLTLGQIGLVAAIYPITWGVTQLFTGSLGDHLCKKQLISSGMGLQALGLITMALTGAFYLLILSAFLVGIGTALVYPNFLTTVAENTHPTQRAEGLSIFRFWRDLGYVAGALLAGILADQLGLFLTFIIVGVITLLGGLMAERRMCCTLKKVWGAPSCVEMY